MLPLQTVQCPYCGQYLQIAIDDSVQEQQYIEDCQVCCKPIVLWVSVAADGSIAVRARSEDEA